MTNAKMTSTTALAKWKKLISTKKRINCYDPEKLLAILDAWIVNNERIPRAEDFYGFNGVPSYKSYQAAFGRWNTALELLGYGENRGYRKNYGRYTGRCSHQGYIMSYAPEHPFADKDGYALEHRIKMEKYCKRFLRTDEVVHHLDGDRANNSMDNLVLMSRDAHSSLHAYLLHYTGGTIPC